MSGKTLIVYSSGYGATKEVADTIRKILEYENNSTVDIQLIDAPVNVDHYDNIIIGSSIRADRLLANTRDFISANRVVLKLKKVALFILCLSAGTQEGQAQVIDTFTKQLGEKYPDVDFISITAFGGKIDFQKLNPVMQNLIKQVFKKTGVNSSGSIDSRNWEKIVEWANNLKIKLDN